MRGCSIELTGSRLVAVGWPEMFPAMAGGETAAAPSPRLGSR
jgi:hypothetical protein